MVEEESDPPNPGTRARGRLAKQLRGAPHNMTVVDPQLTCEGAR